MNMVQQLLHSQRGQSLEKKRAGAGGGVETWYNSNYIVRGAKLREGMGGIVNMAQQLLHRQGDSV